MLYKNKFINNLVRLSSATLIAQLLLIISSPLLTRLYSPEDFGVFALFISIIGVLSTITNFRYEQAIVIPTKNSLANQLVYLSLVINTIFSFLVLLILLIFAKPIFIFFNIEGLVSFYWVIPIGIFFIGSYQALNYWLVRNQEFKVVARVKIQQSLAMIFIQLSFFKFGPIALILGHSMGQLVGVSKNGFRFLNNSTFNVKGIKSVAIEYKNFPIYSVWSSLLNSTGAQLPILLFTAYYSPAAAGLYMLTQRVIKGPLSIISQAITQIFISDLRNSDHKIKSKLLHINNFLISISIIPLAILVVAGEDLFSLIFGKSWTEAGTVAAILVPWMFLVFICSPVSSLVEYKSKQSSFLIFQVILFITRALSIYTGYIFFESYLDTLKIFSFTSTLVWVGFLYYIMKLCDISLFEWSRILLKKLAIVIVIFSPLYFLELNYLLFWVGVAICTIIAGVIIFERSLLRYED